MDKAATRQLSQVAALKGVAEELQVLTARLALAWILANPWVCCMITGASSVYQVTKNLCALKLVPRLAPDVSKRINRAVGILQRCQRLRHVVHERFNRGSTKTMYSVYPFGRRSRMLSSL